MSEEINCSHCQDTGDYEGYPCPYCKPNKEVEEAERRIDADNGN